MPISAKDKEFMDQVTEYFLSTKTPQEPNGSIRDTAIKFNISRNKVRKILITTGELKSPITEEAVRMRSQGLTIKEIADTLDVSVATVSTALPYEDKMDNTLEPSEHASDVREYRAYEREQLKRQAGLTSKKEKIPSAQKGNYMSDYIGNEKEWKKDIKMSYTETYHRPHRNTWADFDEMREELRAELEEDSSEELKILLESMELMQQQDDDNEKEFKKLFNKKELSDEEEERLEILKYMTGQFLGSLNQRNKRVLEKIAGDRLPPEPMEVIRLHMVLYDEYAEDTLYEDDAEIFRKYGKVEYGKTISRDVIVPSDIPLYALHYVIQRAFGWQNSHLRSFELPADRFKALTNNNAYMWSRMVGVLFRSPLMDESDEFWADDYNGGSFKNWLRKKYTGPYLSQCHGEGILSCHEDMKKLDMDAEYYIMYSRAYNPETQKYDGEEYISQISPVFDHQGNKRPEPKPWDPDETHYRIEIVKFRNIPSDGLRFLFERNPMTLLERLPLDSVLAAGKISLPENSSAEEREYIDGKIPESGDEIYLELEQIIESIISKRIDSPEAQPYPRPFTDVLLYNYDFGDNWRIRITACENCIDLVESGRITQSELDRANVKCREVYRPVLIARDGEMLIDDVGGIHGFAEFLQTINPELETMDSEEKKEARQEKKESLTWAKSMGWHREKVSDFNLL